MKLNPALRIFPISGLRQLTCGACARSFGNVWAVPLESWAEYVQRVTPGLTQTQIAALAGVDQTGVSRWLNGSSVPRAEAVIRFARSLQRSPVEALMAAGHLSPAEVGLKPDLKPSTRGLSNDQLIAEVRRRIAERR